VDPGWITAATALVLAVVGGIAWFTRWAWRLLRRTQDFLDDWGGHPERKGVPARAGVMERLQSVELIVTDVRGELYPNGGGSLRDAVHVIAQDVTSIKTEQTRVAENLARLQKGRQS
jgi:hypothetical protein